MNDILTMLESLTDNKHYKFIIIFLCNIIPGTVYLFQVNPEVFIELELIKFLLLSFFYSFPHFAITYIICILFSMDFSFAEKRLKKQERVKNKIIAEIQKIIKLTSKLQDLKEQLNGKGDEESMKTKEEIKVMEVTAENTYKSYEELKDINEENIDVLDADHKLSYAVLLFLIISVQIIVLLVIRISGLSNTSKGLNSLITMYIVVYSCLMIGALGFDRIKNYFRSKK